MILNIVMERAREIYGDNIPEKIMSRIKTEMNCIEKTNSSFLYSVASDLVKESHKRGFAVNSRGMIASSLVAYLVGITNINPMPAHYYCSCCGFYEDVDRNKISVTGLELEKGICPRCGVEMKSDGMDIPYETLFGDQDRDVKKPFIALNFAAEVRGEIFEYIYNRFGKERVAHGGTTLIRDGVRKRVGCHPGAVFIAPEGTTIEDVTPIDYVEDFDGKEKRVTRMDYCNLDEYFTRINVLNEPGFALSLLHRLEKLRDIE